jgi:hypothetical protein
MNSNAFKWLDQFLEQAYIARLQRALQWLRDNPEYPPVADSAGYDSPCGGSRQITDKVGVDEHPS